MAWTALIPLTTARELSELHSEKSAQERYGPVAAGPEKGHKNDKRAGAPLL